MRVRPGGAGSLSDVKLTRIGYWHSEQEPQWPDPATMVDGTWDEREREQVADYLDAGIVPWASPGRSPCRLCGKPNGSSERTDFVFVWPEGLSHYVRNHAVRLPQPILDHILNRWAEVGFERVEVDDAWWRGLTDSA